MERRLPFSKDDVGRALLRYRLQVVTNRREPTVSNNNSTQKGLIYLKGYPSDCPRVSAQDALNRSGKIGDSIALKG